MTARRLPEEDGKALLIVLIFITVFGLILAGLLTEADASLTFTNTVKEHEAKVYAADAGVSFGIQQLRQNNEVCPGVGLSGPPIPDVTVNGRAVTVDCSVTSGSTFGGQGFAIVTTAAGVGAGPDSLILQSSHPKKVSGPVYVTGTVDWGPGLDLDRGNFYQLAGAGCSVGDAAPPELTLESPPYGYYCTTLARPDPAHAPPTLPTVAAAAPTTSGSCRTFYPGLYTSPPLLYSGDNYFVSGDYYFNLNNANDADNVFSIKQATVYGGQPSLYEESQRRFPSPPACAQSDPPGVTGKGVEFIFGGRARMYIDTQGQAELFSRYDTSSPASKNISFLAVPDEAAWTGPGWAPNTLPDDSTFPVLDIKEGNQQDLAIHGLIYAPWQRVVLAATNEVVAQSLGGLMASTVQVKASASAQSLAISVATGYPDPRRVVITATAPGDSGGAPVVSTAVIGIGNQPSPVVTVESWRTRVPTATGP